MDEIQKLKAERRQKKAESRKKVDGNLKKETSHSIPRSSQLIEANFGDFTMYLFQTQLNSLFQKIWHLDLRENHSLDERVLSELLNDPQSLAIDLDYELVRYYIQNEFFFRVNEKEIVPYGQFKQFWQKYERTESNNLKLTKKREFIAFLHKKYKPRWVHEDGSILSEDEYHILSRFEREPKSIERLFNFVNKHYFTLMNDATIALFLKQIRSLVAKTIKDELLQITKEAKL